MWLLDWPPGYSDWSPFRGYIFNVYTNPEHRRQGLAEVIGAFRLDANDPGLRKTIGNGESLAGHQSAAAHLAEKMRNLATLTL